MYKTNMPQFQWGAETDILKLLYTSVTLLHYIWIMSKAQCLLIHSQWFALNTDTPSTISTQLDSKFI